MKDDELKKIFSAMNLEAASPQQLQRWQTALHATRKTSALKLIQQLWWQWLAAGAVGFACAMIFIHQPINRLDSQNKKEILMEDATYEYSYSK